ncbi:type II secretion system protein GspI [Sphingomonas psychrotolerans]|uniref:Type II secretion system protein I n=1 Tax=Sphingomonas psychrotolerans TaxID=1327635 RepID=A0A2K8MDR0_9SPHN|nr:type II secretion system protein GspI [Sphingomonas psychrotolerans]
MTALPLLVLRRRPELWRSSGALSTQGSGLRRSTIVADDDGFSLIEALVALAVLAIATVGLMRTVQSHIDSTRGVERRTAAMWVAENRLAELETRMPTASADRVEMLGEQWRIAVTRRGTDDPEIQRVRIEVFPVQESTPLASLDGFVDGRKG